MATQNQTNQFGSKQVAFGMAPKEGPRAFPLTLDFSTSVGGSLTINLIEQSQQNMLEWIQSVYVDNSANVGDFTLIDSITGQRITVSGGDQAYLPFMCGGNAVFTATISSGTPTVPLQLLTFPVPAIVWTGGGQVPAYIGTVSMAGSTGTDFSSAKPVLAAQLLATSPVNANRKNIEAQNQSADQLQCVLDDGAGSNVSVVLLQSSGGANMPGGSWTSQTFKGRVRLFGPNAGAQAYLHED